MTATLPTTYAGYRVTCGFLNGNLGDEAPHAARYAAALAHLLEQDFPGAVVEVWHQPGSGTPPAGYAARVYPPDGPPDDALGERVEARAAELYDSFDWVPAAAVPTGGVKPLRAGTRVVLQVSDAGENEYTGRYLCSVFGWTRGRQTVGQGADPAAAFADWCRLVGADPVATLREVRFRAGDGYSVLPGGRAADWSVGR